MTTAITQKKPTSTKPETILKLVRRKSGASLKNMQDATSWQPHSVRAALTGLRKKGHLIERAQDGKGVTVYRIAEGSGK
jgi:hypothetical protein